MGVKHFELSAKTGENVKELFASIVDMLAEKQSEPILPQKIMEGDSQQNLSKITEQNVELTLEDSPNIKLSPRKVSQTHRSRGSNSSGSQLRNKEKCC